MSIKKYCKYLQKKHMPDYVKDMPGVEVTGNRQTGQAKSSALMGMLGSLGGGIGGVLSSIFQNTIMKRYQDRQYDKQRQDALSDWHMMNSYNSPQAQMARLKAAGLNPNLVYGQGAVANTVKGPDNATPTRNFVPQQIPVMEGINNGISRYYEIKQMEQQIATGKAQERLANAGAIEKLEKPAYWKSVTSNLDAKEYGQNIANDIALATKRDIIATKSAFLRDLNASIGLKGAQTNAITDRNKRENQMAPVNFYLGMEKILSMKAQTAKSYTEAKYYTALANKAANDATQSGSKFGGTAFGLDFGFYGEQKGHSQDKQMQEIDEYLKAINNDYYKMNKKDRQELYDKIKAYGNK